MNLGLLLEPIDYIWQVVQGHFNWPSLFVKFSDQFVVVAQLVLTLLQLVLVVFIAFIVQVLYFFFDLFCSLLEMCYFSFIEQLQLLLNIAHLLRHCVVLFRGRFPRSSEKLDDFETFFQMI